MTNLSWPRALPCPDLSGLSVRADDGVLRSEMASGVRRERRLYDHAPGVYSASLTLSRTETLILQSFAQKAMGSEFQIDLPLPFDLTNWTQTYTARFESFGEPRPISGATWRTSFNLHLKRMSVPDFDTLGLIAEYGDDADDFINALDHLVNVEMPDHVGAS